MNRRHDPNRAHGLRRSHLLGCCAALAAGLFTSLPARAGALALGEGLFNPCRPQRPDDAEVRALVAAAFDGVDARSLWDTHCHLLGIGDSGSGCSVHPAMTSAWHPMEVLRMRSILNAACVPPGAASVDREFVRRLLGMADEFPAGARWLLFAFERAHGDDGAPRADWTSFHVPDRYAASIAKQHPERFGWVASIHPYRADAIEALDAAVAAGAVAVKWLPSAMNIDLGDARCRPFYARLARTRLPLVVHCGEEKAVPGADRADLGNPLALRAALERGVRVIVAHAASLGEARDTDRRSAPLLPAFDLSARLMDEPRWRELLLADISALFQVNREPRVWRTVLEREDWHARLLHGSDHPLPGVMPLYSPARLAAQGLLDARAVEPLRRVREHNALLFDFVLKRHLHHGSLRFPPAVFETRRHFARVAAAHPEESSR
jgi:mannonate dehydratase